MQEHDDVMEEPVVFARENCDLVSAEWLRELRCTTSGGRVFLTTNSSYSYLTFTSKKRNSKGLPVHLMHSYEYYRMNITVGGHRRSYDVIIVDR